MGDECMHYSNSNHLTFTFKWGEVLEQLAFVAIDVGQDVRTCLFGTRMVALTLRYTSSTPVVPLDDQ